MEVEMKQLLEDIVKAIVDKSDEVNVKMIEGDSTEIYELTVGEGDQQLTGAQALEERAR